MCKKLQTRVAAVTAHSSPRLAITFTPIISAASHPMPDIYTPVVNAPILTICHMLLCLLGRICHKELIVVTSLKVPVNFRNACLHPSFGKQTIRGYGKDTK